MKEECCPKCFNLISSDENGLFPGACQSCGASFIPMGQSLKCGQEIGNYKVVNLIARGGMGEVYLVKQKNMDRMVAMKVLSPSLAMDIGHLNRFLREVRTLAQIEHPNVVKAIEVGEFKGLQYFTMMYVDGVDLGRRLDKGERFSETTTLKIGRVIADTLRYAWEKHRLLHRDIKPANIMMTADSELKLMDLGISRLLDEDSKLTVDGTMVGSPHYISPEQARADKVLDFRSDMYSLGGTLYHMMTGLPPYPVGGAMLIISSHLRDPVPDPREVCPELSDASANLVAKMMAKAPDERFASWKECVVAIDRVLERLGDSYETIYMDSSHDLDHVKSEPKPVHEQNTPVKKIKFPPARIFRIAVLLVMLVACFVMLGIVIDNIFGNEKKKRASRLYDQALELDRRDGTKFEMTLDLLERVRRSGDPEFAKLARKKIDELEQRRVIRKQKKEEIFKNLSWQRLKSQVFYLEQEQKYEKAIDLLRKYQSEGIYRADFAPRLEEELDYLQRQKEKFEKGFLE